MLNAGIKLQVESRGYCKGFSTVTSCQCPSGPLHSAECELWYFEFFSGRFIFARYPFFFMKLEFHGAAGGVTGSHMILESNGFRIGIDAGLFQGSEAVRNREGFGYSPGTLKMLLLTHAHIDHSGRIPLLVKEGFSGANLLHFGHERPLRVDAERLSPPHGRSGRSREPPSRSET